MKKYLLLTLISVMLIGCKSDSTYLPEVSGNPYEVLIVAADKDILSSTAVDTLKGILREEVPMLNNYEPQLDIVTVVKQGFKSILQRHRNVIEVNIGSQFDKTVLSADYDKYSKPQLVIYLNSPSVDSLKEYIIKNGNSIRTFINRTELDRFITRTKELNINFISDSVKNMFNINIAIPKGYKIRNSVDDNFIWISNETPMTSQGLFIYSYPHDSTQKITLKRAIDVRNQFAALIPGPIDGSFMTTSTEFPPLVYSVEFGGRKWVQLRGFWDVENDFMGGPFVSYSTDDVKNNRIVVIDCYVYSPNNNRKPKRNLVRQLEAIAESVTFN